MTYANNYFEKNFKRLKIYEEIRSYMATKCAIYALRTACEKIISK